MNSERESRVKGRLQLSNSKLNTLLEITNAINNNSSETALYQIFEEVLTSTLDIGKFVLYVFDNGWKPALSKKVDKRKLRGYPIEEIVAAHPEISTLTSSEVMQSQLFDIVVPVLHDEAPLACLLLADLEDQRIEISPIIKHLKFIQTLANIVVVALENKRLNKEYIKQAEVKKELELAQNMQSLLFPSKLPHDQELRVEAYYEPHSEVGGDYYDVIDLDEDRIAFLIADVSGKGMSAALLMANFQANLRAMIKLNDDLSTLVSLCNEKVIDSARYEKFITLFVAIYDRKKKVLNYLNAGHQPAILRDGEEIKLLQKGCTVLGMFDQLPSIESGKIKISKPSTLLGFTDGVSELENEEGEQVETAELVSIIQRSSDVNQLKKNLLQKINQLKKSSGISDDITFLAVDFLP